MSYLFISRDIRRLTHTRYHAPYDFCFLISPYPQQSEVFFQYKMTNTLEKPSLSLTHSSPISQRRYTTYNVSYLLLRTNEYKRRNPFYRTANVVSSLLVRRPFFASFSPLFFNFPFFLLSSPVLLLCR